MSIVTDEQKQQFMDEGYFILESVIPEHHLELLRSQCQAFIDKKDAQMDALGTDVQGIIIGTNDILCRTVLRMNRSCAIFCLAI